MGNRIKIENIEDRIRSKLGVSEPYLSNEDINYPDVIDVAQMNIVSLFPNYNEFDINNATYLESIIILECCILLSPSMSARLPKKELGPHASHELWINWDKKKEEFINERDSLIGRLEGLLNPDVTLEGFRSFGVTYPKRGW